MATLAGSFRPLFAHLDDSRDGRFAFPPARLWRVVLGLALLGACRHVPAIGGVALVDDAGDTLRVSQPFRRVVSLSPATTELVFAIGAGPRLVGRTRWCDYPAEVRQVTDVGDGLQPNLEAVLATQPDLVLLYRSPGNAEAARRIRAAGVAAVQLQVDRLEDVPRLARILGVALGSEAGADSLVRAFDGELAVIRASGWAADSARRGTLLLAWDAPPIAIGGASFQSEILALAGGRNVFGDLDRPSAEVSLESIVARHPALVLINGARAPDAFSRPEWRAIPAIRERRFLPFANPAFDRPSPRAPEVIRALHAELVRAIP